MEALLAIGLTSNIISFIDFANEAVSTIREIYKNGSTAKHDCALTTTEALTRDCDKIRHKLEQEPKPQTQDNYDLDDLNKRCLKTAGDLRNLLISVRPFTTQRKLDRFKTTFQSFKSKAKVTELQEQLNSYRSTLNSVVLTQIRQNHDLQVAIQHKEFENLDNHAKELAISLSSGLTNLEDITRREATDTRLLILSTQRRVHDEATAHDYLTSLSFPDIHTRYENVAPAYKETFEWIYKRPEVIANHQISVWNRRRIVKLHEVAGNMDLLEDFLFDPLAFYTNNMNWDDFTEFWRSEKDMYWISGAMGSGKSTLMSFLCHDPRTKQLLDEWDRPERLLIAHFFFWRAGSLLHHSLVGLLRSILYQVLKQAPQLLTFCLNNETLTRDNPLRIWTEMRLLETLDALLVKSEDPMRLVIFIDGLDEMDGDQSHLLSVISELAKKPNVKICLSSRPEALFEKNLQNCAKLRLHTLNLQDIATYVIGSLATAKIENSVSFDLEDIARKIIIRAKGVFLWTKLVTKSVVIGIIEENSQMELNARIDQTPDEIGSMYEYMLNKLNPLYQAESARFFKLINTYRESARFKDSRTYREGLRLTRTGFEEIEYSVGTPLWFLALAANSRLDISPLEDRGPAWFFDATLQQRVQHLPQRMIIRGACLLHILPRHPASCLPAPKEFSSLSSFHNTVDFAHRSAYDFIFNNATGQAFLEHAADFNADETIAKCYIASISVFKGITVPTLGSDLADLYPLHCSNDLRTFLGLMYALSVFVCGHLNQAQEFAEITRICESVTNSCFNSILGREPVMSPYGMFAWASPATNLAAFNAFHAISEPWYEACALTQMQKICILRCALHAYMEDKDEVTLPEIMSLLKSGLSLKRLICDDYAEVYDLCTMTESPLLVAKVFEMSDPGFIDIKNLNERQKVSLQTLLSSVPYYPIQLSSMILQKIWYGVLNQAHFGDMNPAYFVTPDYNSASISLIMEIIKQDIDLDSTLHVIFKSRPGTRKVLLRFAVPVLLALRILLPDVCLREGVSSTLGEEIQSACIAIDPEVEWYAYEAVGNDHHQLGALDHRLQRDNVHAGRVLQGNTIVQTSLERSLGLFSKYITAKYHWEQTKSKLDTFGKSSEELQCSVDRMIKEVEDVMGYQEKRRI